MPAMLDDPTSPTIYRASGQGPYPGPGNPQIPSSIFPRPVTLRDRVTVATLIPFFAPDAVPPGMLAYLSETLNKEIEQGDTYPMINPIPLDAFGPYWFGNFGAVMVLGDIGGIEECNDMERNGADWTKLCLGSFYVKPNYPGRSSHVCNAGFLVTSAARNRGVGKSMGQCYLDWAPQLGYTYSVFNLVYETNTASTRIWDSLGFKRIGRVPGCGNLKSFDEPVDAIIYGRDLKSEGESVASEERFDKIRYYLRHSLYPQGADRSEKSRLRSAATHYKLIGGEEGIPEKLMLKDKEVISDPQAQYDIAKQIHLQSHGGINKTTAMIATKYHWVRIKETVSHVIKNCADCKDNNKGPIPKSDSSKGVRSRGASTSNAIQPDVTLDEQDTVDETQQRHDIQPQEYGPSVQPSQIKEEEETMQDENDLDNYDDMTIDPQIMEQMEQIQAQLQLASEYEQQQAFAHSGMSQFSNTSLQHPALQQGLEDNHAHYPDTSHLQQDQSAQFSDPSTLQHPHSLQFPDHSHLQQHPSHLQQPQPQQDPTVFHSQPPGPQYITNHTSGLVNHDSSLVNHDSLMEDGEAEAPADVDISHLQAIQRTLPPLNYMNNQGPENDYQPQ